MASSSSNAGGQLFGVVLDDNNSLQAPSSTIIENAKGPYRYINQNISTSTRSVNIAIRFSRAGFLQDDRFFACAGAGSEHGISGDADSSARRLRARHRPTRSPVDDFRHGRSGIHFRPVLCLQKL